jgi:AraC family transcriptional regulator
MVSEFDRKHHDLLAGLIGSVLRCRTGLIRVPNLAHQTGFSRFHLARLFREVTDETLEGFVRRIRLERAGFLLLSTEQTVEEVAAECGYANAESFCRAFKSAFGSPPTRFRQEGGTWRLHSPTGLHWNVHWGSE